MALAVVSTTAILTLRARVDEHLRSDGVLDDPVAAEWFEQLDWPPELDAWYSADAQTTIALRAHDMDHITTRFVEAEHVAQVVELGCGLSTRRQRLRGLHVDHWLDVDLPGVVSLRQSWGADGPHVGASVLDFSWMDQVKPPALFIAEGLLYYLPPAGVDDLLGELKRRFGGCALMFDALGPNDFTKLLEKTTALGCPIQWELQSGIDAALDEVGLARIEGFEPDILAQDMLRRYWDRFDHKLRGVVYFAMTSPLARAGLSGNVIGRL